MVQQSFSPLKFRHISTAANEIIEYIKERRSGNVLSLKTRWKRFNDLCMGGIEPSTIYTIAGISGSGKSSFANSLETDLFDLNPGIDFCVLSFNFEMLSSKQVGRKLSSKMNKTTSELYSGNSSVKLTDKDVETIEQHAAKIKQYEIYYVDKPGNVDDICGTIEYFQRGIAKGRWLLVMLDHTLLTRGKTGESERVTLAELEKMLMEVKKDEETKTTVIQLSQMNRNIESADRISTQSLQFPVRSDIFGGDSVFQASDYLFVLHRPDILGIDKYGVNYEPVENMVYLHVLKNREGELTVIRFHNNLKYNRIEDIPLGTPMQQASVNPFSNNIFKTK